MNPDKKKTMVLAALFVVILGVGAFQFMAGGETPPPPAKKDDKAKADAKKDAVQPIKNPGYYPLAAHDPFIPATFINEATPDPTPQQPAPQPDNSKKGPVWQDGGNGPRLKNHGDPRGLIPGPLEGGMPAGGNKGTGTEVKPMEVEKPKFGYTLIGIVVGNHPTAVFDDGQGNQQLVEVGQSVGPNAKVIAISRGTVRIRFNAETLTFNVGGNPNAQ